MRSEADASTSEDHIELGVDRGERKILELQLCPAPFVESVGQEQLHGGRIDVLNDAKAPHTRLTNASTSRRRGGAGGGPPEGVIHLGVLAVEHGIAEAGPVLGNTALHLPHGGVVDEPKELKIVILLQIRALNEQPGGCMQEAG